MILDMIWGLSMGLWTSTELCPSAICRWLQTLPVIILLAISVTASDVWQKMHPLFVGGRSNARAEAWYNTKCHVSIAITCGCTSCCQGSSASCRSRPAPAWRPFSGLPKWCKPRAAHPPVQYFQWAERRRVLGCVQGPGEKCLDSHRVQYPPLWLV